MHNNLNRFLNAQAAVYDDVLKELGAGRKTTHWMWFIFPQIEGLGQSERAQFYAIKNREEAIEYMGHPVLANRLMECTHAVLDGGTLAARDIFGTPDDLKLRSSMTLFDRITDDSELSFRAVLDRFFNSPCEWTLRQLA